MTAIITIDNSYSTVSNMSVGVEKQLRDVLSYTEDANSAYFRGSFPKKISLMNRRGEFPTGLLFRLITFLYDNKIDYLVKDKRIKPSPGRPLNLVPEIKPYIHQESAALTALVSNQGCISMPTGSGKSLVIALIAARLNVKTLVIVPTLGIKEQLTQSLKTAIKGKHLVTVENIGSTKLKTMKDFDCLIIDEAHHSASKTYRNLNKTAWNKIYYRFFLTATPFRSNQNENILFQSIAGEVTYQLDYHTAVTNNYIVPIESYYIEMPGCKTESVTWQQVYSELVVNNAVRNDYISELLTRLGEQNISTLCLVKEIEHGNILSAKTGFDFVNGLDQNSQSKIENFNLGKIKVLIGTEGILGEGIDTRPCEYVVIAGLGKAKSAFMQKCGRSVRKHGTKESGKIILIKDKSHKFLLRHFKEECRILKDEYGSKPIRIDI